MRAFIGFWSFFWKPIATTITLSSLSPKYRPVLASCASFFGETSRHLVEHCCFYTWSDDFRLSLIVRMTQCASHLFTICLNDLGYNLVISTIKALYRPLLQSEVMTAHYFGFCCNGFFWRIVFTMFLFTTFTPSVLMTLANKPSTDASIFQTWESFGSIIHNRKWNYILYINSSPFPFLTGSIKCFLVSASAYNFKPNSSWQRMQANSLCHLVCQW